MFYLLRPILFPSLSLLFRTMLFEYPSVLSRFCLIQKLLVQTYFAPQLSSNDVCFLAYICILVWDHNKNDWSVTHQIKYTGLRQCSDMTLLFMMFKTSRFSLKAYSKYLRYRNWGSSIAKIKIYRYILIMKTIKLCFRKLDSWKCSTLSNVISLFDLNLKNIYIWCF